MIIINAVIKLTARQEEVFHILSNKLIPKEKLNRCEVFIIVDIYIL